MRGDWGTNLISNQGNSGLVHPFSHIWDWKTSLSVQDPSNGHTGHEGGFCTVPLNSLGGMTRGNIWLIKLGALIFFTIWRSGFGAWTKSGPVLDIFRKKTSFVSGLSLFVNEFWVNFPLWSTLKISLKSCLSNLVGFGYPKWALFSPGLVIKILHDIITIKMVEKFFKKLCHEV